MEKLSKAIVSVERSELFRKLDRRSLKTIIASAETRRVLRGTSLLKQGDEADHLFVVVDGRIKMTVLSTEGAQTILRFMTPGDVIGCAAVFRRIPYPATAIAVTDSKVLCWTAAQFDAFLRTHGQLAANALALVGERAEEMLKRLRAALTEDVEQRLARALLRVPDRTKSSQDDGTVIIISRQDLAELADTTLFTASRTISSWARNGIVKRGRGRVTVLDYTKLSGIAENVGGPRN